MVSRRNKTAFLVVFLILNVFLGALSYFSAEKSRRKMLEIERKIALLPLPLPTPTPITSITDANTLVNILYNKECYGNHPIRAQAAERLGTLKAHVGVPALIEMLNDHTSFSSPAIEGACAQSLGDLKAVSAVPELILAVRNGNTEAVAALGKIGADKAIEFLLDYLEEIKFSQDERFKPIICTIIETLIQLRHTEAIPLLKTIAQGPHKKSDDPSFIAVIALGEMNAVSVVPFLLSLDGSDGAFLTTVTKAIEKLLMHDRTVKSVIKDPFDSATNINKWPLHGDFYSSVRLQGGSLSLFQSRRGEQITVFPQKELSFGIYQDYLARVKIHWLKGWGNEIPGFIFGQTSEKHYKVKLMPVEENTVTAQIVRVNIEGGEDKTETLLSSKPFVLDQFWTSLMIRHVDSVVSLFANNRYLGSFRTRDAEGKIGLYVKDDNHVRFDDFEIDSVTGPRILWRELSEGKEKRREEKNDDALEEGREDRNSESKPGTRTRSSTARPTPTKRPEPVQSEETATPRPIKKGMLHIKVNAQRHEEGTVFLYLDGKQLCSFPVKKMEQVKQARWGKYPQYSIEKEFSLSPGNYMLKGHIGGTDREKSNGAEIKILIKTEQTKTVVFQNQLKKRDHKSEGEDTFENE